MSNTQSQPNQPLATPSTEPDSEPLDTKLDEPIGAISDNNTTAENIGSPIKDEGSKATDIDEL